MALYDRFTGNATDNYGATIQLATRTKQIDVTAFSNSLDFTVAYEIDEAMFEGDIEVPAGQTLQTPLAAKALKIRNHTSGQVARYEIVAWYIPTPYR